MKGPPLYYYYNDWPLIPLFPINIDDFDSSNNLNQEENVNHNSRLVLRVRVLHVLLLWQKAHGFRSQNHLMGDLCKIIL